MTAIQARTNAEADEYMYLVTAECYDDNGSAIFSTTTSAELVGDNRVVTYDVECLDGSMEWHFTVTVDPQPERTDGTPLQFGYGSEPSRLIDAGQWYLLFARWLALARDVQEQQEPDGRSFEPLELEEMVGGFDHAQASLAEVLKFIPAGQDRVPESAVWTDQGRWSYEEEPGQFTRDQLEKLRGQMITVRDFYVDQYRRMDEELP